MSRTKKTLIAIGAALALAVPAAAVSAQTLPGDDAEMPITGEALTRASEAALAHIGEGEVTETEMGDEESFYEVEVTRADGTQVDVQLDEAFLVVGTEEDGADDSSEDSAPSAP